MAEQVVDDRPSAAGFAGPSAFSRVYGLGSIFGKTLRDSRWAIVVVGLLLGGIVAGTASQIAAEFGTLEARQQLVAQMQLLPAIFVGLLGEPINIATLPGFISWRVMGTMPVLIGTWSIVALSGTLAGEARRGTLELVLASPVGRLSLGLQKLAAHVAALSVALVLGAVLTWLGMIAFGTLPGDEASLPSVLAEFAYVGVMSLLFGSLAFALGPLLGKGSAVGTATALLFGSFIVNGYGEMLPGFDVVRQASPFYWATQHRPLAGISDWPALASVALLAAGLAAAGLWLFHRRDLASTVALTTRRASGAAARWNGWSLAGVGRRALAELMPEAIGWGAGLGGYGLFIALSAPEFARVLDSLPQLGEIIQRFFPGVDMGSAGAILQLAMFNFASLIVGLAAASLVHAWAADERERRLEIVLAAPVERLGWAARSSAAVLVAILVFGLVAATGTALGVMAVGDSLGGPLSGVLVLALYAAALAGVGFALAGLGWPKLAGPAVGALGVGSWLLDFIGSALALPEHVLNLALVRHLGQPMAGIYNDVGLLACAVLTVGGLLLGALAFRRRDLTI